jgi:L-asparagine transporter-like permease
MLVQIERGGATLAARSADACRLTRGVGSPYAVRCQIEVRKTSPFVSVLPFFRSPYWRLCAPAVVPDCSLPYLSVVRSDVCATRRQLAEFSVNRCAVRSCGRISKKNEPRALAAK